MIDCLIVQDTFEVRNRGKNDKKLQQMATHKHSPILKRVDKATYIE